MDNPVKIPEMHKHGYTPPPPPPREEMPEKLNVQDILKCIFQGLNSSFGGCKVLFRGLGHPGSEPIATTMEQCTD